MAVFGECVNDVVDVSSFSCLNEDSENLGMNCLQNDHTYLESDVDPQLLLHVPFREVVNLSALRIAAAEEEEAPASVKIFTNKTSFGFEDAESDPALQQNILSCESMKDIVTLPLSATRFRNVHSLQVFVESNHGGATTRLRYLEMVGSRPNANQNLPTQAKRGRGKAGGGVSVLRAADVASRMNSHGADVDLAIHLLHSAAAAGHPGGRELVRKATGIFLNASAHASEKRRRALLTLGAYSHIVSLDHVHGQNGAGMFRKAKHMVLQGVMSVLEELSSTIPWSVKDISDKAHVTSAWQLLCTMPLEEVVTHHVLLSSLLSNSFNDENTSRNAATMAAQWLQRALSSPVAVKQRAMQELASLFVTLLVRQATSENIQWCRLAAESLQWLPIDFQSEQLRAVAGLAPSRNKNRREKDQGDALHEWAVDVHELPAYSFPDSCCVIWVDTVDHLEELRSAACDHPVLGIDTEWGADGNLCVLQISAHLSCFLVDARRCMGQEYVAALQSALENVFSCRVVAWSFKEDARRLVALHPPLVTLLAQVEDLQIKVRKRLGLSQSPSLRRACGELLGAALDKGEQRSDWEQRPLTESQKLYAASDARVLLDLDIVLQEERDETITCNECDQDVLCDGR